MREDEADEDFFISSDYQKPEIISSDDEANPADDYKTEELHSIVRAQFLASLTSTENVDVKNPIFNNLTYSDQLGILDDVREIYRFGRSQINPYQRAEKVENDDIEFSEYQLQGILARGKMRNQIRDIEDKRKVDRVHDLLLSAPKKLSTSMARKVGQKYALFDLDKSDENSNSTPPKKKVRSILDIAEPPKPTLSESSEDEFIDVSDQSETEETETQKSPKIPRPQFITKNTDIEKAIALSLQALPGTSQNGQHVKIPDKSPLESDSDEITESENTEKYPTEEEQMERAIKMSLTEPSINVNPQVTEPKLDTVGGLRVNERPGSSSNRQLLLSELSKEKKSLLTNQKKLMKMRNSKAPSAPADAAVTVSPRIQPIINSPDESEVMPDDSSQIPESIRPKGDFNVTSILAENANQRRKLESAGRISSVPNQNLYLDAAELLDLFGVGILFAPGEAEAQCACMEQAG